MKTLSNAVTGSLDGQFIHCVIWARGKTIIHSHCSIVLGMRLETDKKLASRHICFPIFTKALNPGFDPAVISPHPWVVICLATHLFPEFFFPFKILSIKLEVIATPLMSPNYFPSWHKMLCKQFPGHLLFSFKLQITNFSSSNNERIQEAEPCLIQRIS